MFEITYRGTHTCSQASNSVQPPTSPEKQDQKPNNHNINPQQQQSEHSNPKFPSNLRVITEELGNRKVVESPFSFPSNPYGCMKGEDSLTPLVLDNETFLGVFSPSFISPGPATPESNYYPVSANTSATNSPIPELDFTLDPVDFDTNFPFDTPGFFS